MQIAVVLGTIVATIKHKAFMGRKLLMVQPLTPFGKPKGKVQIAVDVVQAGEGDIVLLLSEGNSSRQVLAYENAPVRSTIIGVIDHIELDATKK